MGVYELLAVDGDGQGLEAGLRDHQGGVAESIALGDGLQVRQAHGSGGAGRDGLGLEVDRGGLGGGGDDGADRRRAVPLAAELQVHVELRHGVLEGQHHGVIVGREARQVGGDQQVARRLVGGIQGIFAGMEVGDGADGIDSDEVVRRDHVIPQHGLFGDPTATGHEHVHLAVHHTLDRLAGGGVVDPGVERDLVARLERSVVAADGELCLGDVRVDSNGFGGVGLEAVVVAGRQGGSSQDDEFQGFHRICCIYIIQGDSRSGRE